MLGARESFFTTESAEGAEARKRKKGSPDLDPKPFPSLLIRLCVLCVLCGERSGNCSAFKPFGALEPARQASGVLGVQEVVRFFAAGFVSGWREDLT